MTEVLTFTAKTMNSFKMILFLASLFILQQGFAQPMIPQYTILATETISLNKLCHIQAGATHNGVARYEKVIEDSSGNLYFAGKAESTPALSPVITLGVNQASSFSTPISDNFYFVSKYSSDGNFQWVTQLTAMPKKMMYDEKEETLILLFERSQMDGSGLGINGHEYTLDSNYGENDLVLFMLDPSNGHYVNQYINRFTQDFIFYGSKKLLVYRRFYSSSYSETMYGYFENNQVYKWQTTLNGYTSVPTSLIYNPIEHSFWTINGVQCKRLIPHPTEDSLIAEHNVKEIFHQFSPLYSYLMKPSTYRFTADGGYIAEIQGTIDLNNYPSRMVKIDSSGNLVWQIIFKDNFRYPYQLDMKGDIWFDVNEIFYSTRFTFLPSNEEYMVNPYGNTPLFGNYIWQIDGKTGTLKNAYYNGFGTVGQLKNYQFLITSKNELVTMPEHGSVAYFPNNAGEFISYSTSCNNVYKAAQFLWVKYPLNQLISFKTELTSLEQLLKYQSDLVFDVYPNPAQGLVNIHASLGSIIEVYDLNGKCLDQFEIQNEKFTYSVDHLPQGIYVLRNRNNGQTIKLSVD